MPAQVPAIYSPVFPPEQLPWAGRLICLSVAIPCAIVLIMATQVLPNPHGLGTHLELGMGACTFLHTTGCPCPTCGMTTSFAWFVRGNWAGSFYVQPMGFLFALAMSIALCVSGYMAITGRAIQRHLNRLPMARVGWIALGLFVIAWIWKIWIYRHGIDGWS